MKEADSRAALVRYYRWLRTHGLNDSHSGNASVLDGAALWVTPSGCCGDTLEPADLLACPRQGSPPAGASLDAPLHQAVYRHNPAAAAMLHSHGPWSIAVTLAGGNFTPGDFEGRYYFDEVPVLDIPPDRYTAESPEAVGRTLAEHRVCLVRGHGVYAVGASLDEAYRWTCSLESSARIAGLGRLLGMPR
ncbi:MAG: class II aldolase/adducin family protein [Gammaproteobacteria bacterium]